MPDLGLPPAVKRNASSFRLNEIPSDAAHLVVYNETLYQQVRAQAGCIKDLRRQIAQLDERIANFADFYAQAAEYPALAEFLLLAEQPEALVAALASYVAQLKLLTGESAITEYHEHSSEDGDCQWLDARLSAQHLRVQQLNERVFSLSQEVRSLEQHNAQQAKEFGELQQKHKQLEEYTRGKKQQCNDLTHYLQEKVSSDAADALRSHAPIAFLQQILDEELAALRARKTELLKQPSGENETVSQINAQIGRIQRICEAIGALFRMELDYKVSVQPDRLRALGLTELFILLEMNAQATGTSFSQEIRYSSDSVLECIAFRIKALRALDLPASQGAALKAIGQIKKLTLL